MEREITMNPIQLAKLSFSRLRLVVLLSAILLSGGCQISGKPRLRFGAFWGSPIGMEFTELKHLGNHSYGFTLHETNGMMYTCKGGFIDIAHVRESADRTAYLQKVTYQTLMRGQKKFTFQIIEPSKYRVTLSYPRIWNDILTKEKEAIAKEVSIRLGQYLAHMTLIWHEIVTWYGFATSGIFPDTISAFSWEDTYSDLLGTRLAVQAIRDENRSYDEAMTELFLLKLRELGVQPARVAHEAARQIEGRWFTGGFYFLVHMKRRNLDVGMDDGYITPWLVPGICPDAEPLSYPVPDLEAIYRYGFNADVELEPHILEKSKIYHSIHLAGDKRIRPQVDFRKIMAVIEKQENEVVVSAAIK
jgi:hypothetical protein